MFCTPTVIFMFDANLRQILILSEGGENQWPWGGLCLKFNLKCSKFGKTVHLGSKTPKSCLFSKIFNFYFYFLSLVRTPMNNYAKYQHPKQKFSIFLKNHKITCLHFSRVYKNGPFKGNFFKTFFSMI